MRIHKKLRLFSSCLFAGAFVLFAAAHAAGTEIDAQAKVTLSGSANSTEHHSNEGVVLWLTPADAATSTAPDKSPRSHFQLAQKNKTFTPHLLVVPVGSVVEFPNLDPFYHNVFSLFNGKRFDLGLYESGTSRNVHFDHAGISYIFCNIHPEMSAIVISVPTPYYATSSYSGILSIHDVPPGTYIMHTWAMGNPDKNFSEGGRRISVSGSTMDLGTIALEESPAQAHKNKFGEDYNADHPSTY